MSPSTDRQTDRQTDLTHDKDVDDEYDEWNDEEDQHLGDPRPDVEERRRVAFSGGLSHCARLTGLVVRP